MWSELCQDSHYSLLTRNADQHTNGRRNEKKAPTADRFWRSGELQTMPCVGAGYFIL